jgi:aerobic carbon-monoxide dehydrogenase large subunit
MSRAVFGVRVERREDLPLLTGQGSYTDDLKLPGMLHAAVLRSPHAHAQIRSIEVARARAPRHRRCLHPRRSRRGW